MQEITIQSIEQAAKQLEHIVQVTPLQFSKRLSEKYQALVYLKREDLQEVRSFKIRGAYTKMVSLTASDKERGVVCASAGNHAQGVAYSCSALKIKGTIFMPAITPSQKIDRVRYFGGKYVDIQLVGTTYDDASNAAHDYCKKKKAVYVHPFDDPLTIAGQGTVGKEIYEQLAGEFDVVIAGIGGGGLISGIASYIKQRNPNVQMIGVEPSGAAAMHASLRKESVVTLDSIDPFVDGAAVKRAGDLTFTLCKKYLKKIAVVPEGKVCTNMIELYQNEGIVAEPAGALSVAALDDIASDIKGKRVVCIISGGNNDILRYPEIMERSLVYQGRKHYFIIEFAQKPGQLRQFVDKALGPTDDIVRFEYMKKTNKEKGPALVGVELKDRRDFEPLLQQMKNIGLKFELLTSDDLLYKYLI